MESDYLRSRKSVRVCARKTVEEPGKTIDHVSHPLDKAPVPEPEATPVKRRASSTKKTSGSIAPARVKVEKKPAATRKKAANSTPRTRSTTGASTAKPRSIAKKTLADDPPPNVSAPPVDESQGIEAVGTLAREHAGRVDADSDSELSELATTPRCPSTISNERTESFHKQVQLKNPEEVDSTVPAPTLPTTEDVPPDTPVSAESETLAAPASPPIQTYGSVVTTNALREIYSQSPPVSLTVTIPGPAISPITPASLRQSGRSKTQPTRFGSLVPTLADVDAAEEQNVTEEQEFTEEKDETVSGGDSPIAQKVSRNTKTTSTAKPVRRKKALSQEKLSPGDFAQDVPAVKSRKRKAEASAATPRKRPTKAKDTTGEAFEVKARKISVPRKTLVQRKKKEKTPTTQKNALQLPSPPMSQSDYLEASGLPIDPELL
jgi:hypothetical protein